jgi:hypothetical protein
MDIKVNTLKAPLSAGADGHSSFIVISFGDLFSKELGLKPPHEVRGMTFAGTYFRQGRKHQIVCRFHTF